MVERSQTEVWRLTPWLVIVLLIGNFLLMAFDARQVSTGQRVVRVWTMTAADFVQSPITTLSASVTNYFSSISSMRSAQGENDQLKQRIQELEVEVKASQDLLSENQRLNSLLELKENSKFKVLTARVIGRDPSLWFDLSIVDRGSLDGVKLDMPVVTNGGVVGRVTAVSPLTAQVDLITRTKSGLGAIVGEIGATDALGVVVGSSKRELLEMKYVPGNVQAEVGQIVYTSGQEGIYPAGLRIGEIVEVSAGSATVSKQIFIRPSAGINSMQEVGILLYEPPPPVVYDQALPNAVKKDK